MKILIILLGIAVIYGCATSTQKIVARSDPSVQTAPNEYFDARLWPWLEDGASSNVMFTHFELTIKNKTSRNLEIIWDKTFYIDDGKTNGGFVFEGILYKDRNLPKLPDVIFPGQAFRKKIYPSNLVHFSSGRYGGWTHGNIGVGNRVFILLSVLGIKKSMRKLPLI